MDKYVCPCGYVYDPAFPPERAGKLFHHNFITIQEERKMDKYVCPCGYEYDPAVGDPDNGVAPGTPWEQVPESWVCPVCEMGKEVFEKE